MWTRHASILAVTSLGLLGFSCSTEPASAARWTASTLRFEVKSEGEPDFGQHLLLEWHIRGKTSLHTRLPVDLPEAWRVRDMRLVEHRLEIILEDDRSFWLDPANLDPLQRAILVGDRPKSDQELDALWTAHAR